MKRGVAWSLGWKETSTAGSNNRRAWIRVCLIWVLGFAMWAPFGGGGTVDQYSWALSLTGVSLVGCCLLVFVQVVLLVPFRDDGDSFKLDARRLLLDTLVSSAFTIVAFSFLYRNMGLVGDQGAFFPNAYDAVYFSAVTFSTLGYGDFAPTAPLRLIAAAEALIGNLHLGMLVGSTFAAIKR